jgi:tetratricopeptide (TPR) repeat protein
MSEHEVWNELGNLYLLNGEYRQAVHAYNRSIRLDEAFGRPYSNLALAYVQQGKFDQAIDLYRRSIELLTENKEKAITWNRLGNVYRYLKDYRQAVIAYRNADEIDPENGEGRDEPGWLSEPSAEAQEGTQAGPAKSRSAVFENAVAASAVTRREILGSEAPPSDASAPTWAPMNPTAYQQDLTAAPEPGPLTSWGEPAVEADDPDANWPPDPETEIYTPDTDGDLTRWLPLPEEQPLDELQSFLEDADFDAGSDEPPSLLGELRLETVAVPAKKSGAPSQPQPGGRSAKDAAALDVVVRERGGDKYVVAEEGNDDGAAQPASEPEAREPAPALTGEGPTTAPAPDASRRDASEMREIEAGLAKFKHVVDVNPGNARAWDTLGNLYKSAGRYKEALLAYQQAIEHDPSKALYHHHLGLVYASEGKTEDSVDAFRRVIEIDPDHGLAHAALGGHYRKMGQEELAQKHVGKAMKSIFDSENEYNRACLAAICGNTDEALDLLRVALRTKQTYVDWILRDPDLDFIRQDPRFKQLISDYAR